MMLNVNFALAHPSKLAVLKEFLGTWKASQDSEPKRASRARRLPQTRKGAPRRSPMNEHNKAVTCVPKALRPLYRSL